MRWSSPSGQLRVGSLAVRMIGRGSPIVLLHGLLGSNRYWGRAFDILADDHLVIAPDLLGFGDSPKPPSGYGPAEHVEALLHVLDELGVTEPALFVGHSLGALLAIWMAYRRSECVRGVVALGPPLLGTANEATARIARLGVVERFFARESRVAEIACRELCGARPRIAARLYGLVRPELPRELLDDATRHSWPS